MKKAEVKAEEEKGKYWRRDIVKVEREVQRSKKFFCVCELKVRKEWDAPNTIISYIRMESEHEEEILQTVKGLSKGNKLITRTKVIDSNADFSKRIDRPNGTEDLIWNTGGLR